MDTTVRLGDLGDKCDKDTQLRVGDSLMVDGGTLELTLGVVLALETSVAVEDPAKDEKEEDKGKNRAHACPVKFNKRLCQKQNNID
jgi:hypothetical protein